MKRHSMRALGLLLTLQILARSGELEKPAPVPEAFAPDLIARAEAGEEAAMKQLRRIAGDDHGEAAYVLGVLTYGRLKGLEREHEAGKWFSRSAAAGLAEAGFALAMLKNETPSDMESDSGRGSEFCSASRNFRAALLTLRCLPSNSPLPVQRFRGKVADYVLRRANAGHTRYIVRIPNNFDSLLRELERRATAGDARAMLELARLNDAFISRTRDPRKVIDLARSAAEAGDHHAQYDLGLWLLGRYRRFARSGSEGREWLKKASDARLPDAMTDFAIVSMEEAGDPSLPAARTLLLQAAGLQEERAMIQLGQMAELSADHVDRADYSEAMQWYLQASERNFGTAPGLLYALLVKHPEIDLERVADMAERWRSGLTAEERVKWLPPRDTRGKCGSMKAPGKDAEWRIETCVCCCIDFYRGWKK